ncbi:MAG: thrombospondin type 3 repeat-containing protein [Deltaproteobacteria bacterium]|nr:thrombospondin type 3 repeat-containing protein [Deltaproteobacteria bacterium]
MVAPRSVRIFTPAPYEVEVSWKDVSEGESSYRIQRNTTGIFSRSVTTRAVVRQDEIDFIPPDSESYRDTVPELGIYYYRVLVCRGYDCLASRPFRISLDRDQDGIADLVDNCKRIFNPDQLDSNSDGKGDACQNPDRYIGEWKQLVVLYHSDESAPPPDLDEGDVLNWMQELSNYHREISHGEFWLAGAFQPNEPADVLGWIPRSANIAEEVAKYVSPLEYDNLVYITSEPFIAASGSMRSEVNWAGFGTAFQSRMGIPSNFLQSYLDTGDSTVITRTLIHEFGHTIGLGHSGFLSCREGQVDRLLSPDAPPCQYIAYGSGCDVMGNGSGYPNLVQLERMGWVQDLDAPRSDLTLFGYYQTVTSDGIYSIKPLRGFDEVGYESLKGIVIPRGDGSNFYIEYRRRAGFDAYISEKMNLEGALILLEKPNSVHRNGNLIDPLEGTRRLNPVLQLDETFTDLVSGASITVQAVEDDRLELKVEFN